MQGHITKYFKDKIFGFIKDAKGNEDYFNCRREKSLKPKDAKVSAYLSFDAVETEKGLQAINIALVTGVRQSKVQTGVL